MKLWGLKCSVACKSVFLILSALPVYALGGEVPAKHTVNTWPEKMRGIEKTFTELLIDLNSDERFNSPKNAKKIEKNVEKLSKLAHSLNGKDVQSPDLDPSIQLIAKLFADETDQAYLTLTSGYRGYARKSLKGLTTYCLACHTRSNSGPSFQFTASNSAPLIDSLKSLDKADYLASVRQFDRALEEYQRLIQDEKFAKETPFEWEKAIRSSLALSVRVKKDADLALKIVELTLKSPRVPYFLKEQATAWKQSLTAWKAEKPAQLKYEEDYFREAKRLSEAAKAAQKYPTDRSADMLYLRATSAVHDLLGFSPNGKYAADGLYLAGVAYEVLGNMNLNEMHEFYYLSCIYKVPHTEKARQCFRNYEESVYFGYTGSSGTHLPEKVRSRLDQLDLISNPVELKTKPNSQLQ